MHHTPSLSQIFYTSEYARFNMIGGNRALIESKLNKIKADYLNGMNLFSYFPILVVENGPRLDIADGQHRFFLCRQLKIPVYYLIAKAGINLMSIARMNSNTDKWKSADYINCYVYQGKEDYLQLRSFMESHKVSFTAALNLLAKGLTIADGGTKEKLAFERGDFSIRSLQEAEEVINWVKQFEYFAGRMTQTFIVAIAKCIKEKTHDLDTLVHNSELGARLVVRHTAKDYLTQFDYQLKKTA